MCSCSVKRADSIRMWSTVTVDFQPLAAPRGAARSVTDSGHHLFSNPGGVGPIRHGGPGAARQRAGVRGSSSRTSPRAIEGRGQMPADSRAGRARHQREARCGDRRVDGIDSTSWYKPAADTSASSVSDTHRIRQESSPELRASLHGCDGASVKIILGHASVGTRSGRQVSAGQGRLSILISIGFPCGSVHEQTEARFLIGGDPGNRGSKSVPLLPNGCV